jgi:diadenosine tetraphosphate (Ap4A) HIT family hydrolase
LGVGTLIVKPLRHVLHVADLDDQEVAEMGRLLRDAARLVSELGAAEQVYVCLWSHANREPGHIHYVIQPATARLMDRFDAYGPALQMAMFTTGEAPDSELVSAFADQARAWFAKHTASHQ